MNILDLVGNTPLLKLSRLSGLREDVSVYAKAEFLNPSGSVKDRAAKAMITEGIKSGRLTKDKVIMDATSGSTGNGIVNTILEDYHHARAIDKMDLFNQPDKDIIIDIIKKLYRVVFPGYFRDKSYRIYNTDNNLSVLRLCDKIHCKKFQSQH